MFQKMAGEFPNAVFLKVDVDESVSITFSFSRKSTDFIVKVMKFFGPYFLSVKNAHNRCKEYLTQ